jgi:hypothetical protein
MFALTIKNPAAAAIVGGLKDVENRSWITKYRGPLLIHAARAGVDIGRINSKLFPLITDLAQNYSQDKNTFYKKSKYYFPEGDLLRPRRIFSAEENAEQQFLWDFADGFDFSAIVGVVDLIDVAEKVPSRWAENNLYHWVFRNPMRFRIPEKQIRGKLQLWDFPLDRLNQEILAQLLSWKEKTQCQNHPDQGDSEGARA